MKTYPEFKVLRETFDKIKNIKMSPEDAGLTLRQIGWANDALESVEEYVRVFRCAFLSAENETWETEALTSRKFVSFCQERAREAEKHGMESRAAVLAGFATELEQWARENDMWECPSASDCEVEDTEDTEETS